MSDKKTIEYDHQSSLSFNGNLQTMCTLFGGFAFTGITIILTSGDLSAPLSQFILFMLYMAMGMFIGAVLELNNMNSLVSLHSPKPIIPLYPERWRRINFFITVGNAAILISVALMFLLKNLQILFVLSIGVGVFWFIWNYFRGWKPVEEELRKKGVLR